MARTKTSGKAQIKGVEAAMSNLKGMLRSYEESTANVNRHSDDRENTKKEIYKLVKTKKLFERFGSTETQGPFKKQTLIVNVGGRPFYIHEYNVARSVSNDGVVRWYASAGLDANQILTVTLSPLSDSAKGHDPRSIVTLNELAKNSLIEFRGERQIKIPGKKREVKIK